MACDQQIEMPKPWRRVAGLWSVLVLLVGLGLTVVVYHQQRKRRLESQRAVRIELADKACESLQDRLHAANVMLRAVQTVFLASDEVTKNEYATLYQNLHPRDRFPSMLALAYAQRVTGPGGDDYMIRMVEPRAENASIIGHDIDTQPKNLANVRASRDSDQLTMSALLKLKQEDAHTRVANGIILELPVFSPGRLPRTVEQRRQRTVGSISMSFQADALIDSALADTVKRVMRVRVRDVTHPQHAQLLFDSAPHEEISTNADHFERRITYGGRHWQMTLQPLGTSVSTTELGQSMLPAGILASIFLALLVYSILSTRQRALELGWQLSRRYRESEERFRALNDLLPALVLLAEVDSGRITYANHAAREHFGERMTDHALSDLFEDPVLWRQLQHANVGSCERVEVLLHDDRTARFWASVAISRIELDGRGKLLMVATDTSEQRELNQLLSHQASHDTLTELCNRREFDRRLRDALIGITQNSATVGLLYLDLDQFKLVNDTSGHLAGDQLLIQLSIVMHEHLGDTAVLARLGGDEFGVLLKNVADQAEAEDIAEGLRRCIDGYVFIWEQQSYMISVSIGGVLADRAAVQVKDLMAQADTACYMAKDAGRNRVHFYSERDDLTARRQSEMDWANRLRRAFDEQCLQLVYQEVWPLPLNGGKPGIEVLLRFREPSGERVLPGVFLPSAERYGLMPMIDHWVIETTLANFDRLHPGLDRLEMVSINLSGASIEDQALADWIITLLQRYRIEPARVCFEITETVAVRNLGRVAQCMARLRRAGCRVALDDFGAGMSSFTYLKHLPLDIIKIDGSFVRDMLTDTVSHLMVKAVTDIGHGLDLEVVAEWVVDAPTVQALTDLGVNSVQGFYLHRPELALFHRG